jgi:hypothetical protein
MPSFRTERDPLGELKVSADAYYGVLDAILSADAMTRGGIVGSEAGAGKTGSAGGAGQAGQAGKIGRS